MVHATLERVYREESGRILATLIRLLGDFDLAEEMMHEAFAAAAESWGAPGGSGVPANPRAWLVSTARHKAIDRLRRESRFARKRDELRPPAAASPAAAEELADEEWLGDDRLRLIFTCCHPALA